VPRALASPPTTDTRSLGRLADGEDAREQLPDQQVRRELASVRDYADSTPQHARRDAAKRARRHHGRVPDRLEVSVAQRIDSLSLADTPATAVCSSRRTCGRAASTCRTSRWSSTTTCRGEWRTDAPCRLLLIPWHSNRENYIHRIGRSGRFGRKGVAINVSPARHCAQRQRG